ncbi:glycoside hydrolase family 20 zincin-like fold domain-containing protein [Actinoplanes sp. NPDC026619]|uniref:glycoside hydrolase family 20 zincin-like fold domain-containing protein n=1 Tax=Actinoplanes sp. NPDC026619 TaxID=3155798 RepID=UPI00340A2312
MTILDEIFPAPQRVLPRDGRGALSPIRIGYDSQLPEQAYQLEVDGTGVRVTAGGAAGARYARTTVRQLERLSRRSGEPVPCVRIEDAPAVAVRAVMLDVSRDRVPHVETLAGLIRSMADWKLNQLQLYFENTYAYAGHEPVWADATPYTAADVARIEGLCRDHGIEMLLQQNCLGHAEKWLTHDRYADLAALPGGYHDDRGNEEPPATLDPRSERAFALVTDWLTQLAGLQPRAPRLHIGLDEPLDLNLDLWRAVFAPPGAGHFEVRLGETEQKLYLDWLRRIRELPVLRRRDLVMWADVASANPAVLAGLPPGVTLVEWGYEADHPFDDRAAALAARGVPFWLCAGTNTWNTLAGRPANARATIANAARAAVRHGAGGLVIADWGDNGHTQQPAFSQIVFALAAGYAWNPAAAAKLDWAWLIDTHVADDRAGVLGRSMLAVGDLYTTLPVQVPEGSALAACLGPAPMLARLAAGGVDAAALDWVLAELDRQATALDGADLRGSDATGTMAEVRFTIRLLSYGARRMRAYLTSAPAPAGEYASLLAEYERLWRLRCRTGGLAHSMTMLAIMAPLHSADAVQRGQVTC